MLRLTYRFNRAIYRDLATEFTPYQIAALADVRRRRKSLTGFAFPLGVAPCGKVYGAGHAYKIANYAGVAGQTAD